MNKNYRSGIERRHVRTLDRIWHRAFIHFIQYDLTTFGSALDGVTALEVAILEMVDSRPPVLLKDIIEDTGVPASTLTGAVDRLENRGYLNRIISRRDRRSFGLNLTGEGKNALEEHRKAEQRFFAGVLSALDDGRERERFLADLERVVEQIPRSVT